MRIYRFIQEHRSIYPLDLMVRILEVSTSGFYDWLRRPKSRRARRREELTESVREVFDDNYRIYGSRKVTEALAEQNVKACRNTVARIMQQERLRSRAQRRKFVVTTNSDHAQPIAANVLERDFTAPAPNQKWVADITYIPTASGFAYLAAVMDLCSRRIVGWSVSDSLDASFVIDALRRAIEVRRPGPELIHHSDRGTQYASEAHRDVLETHGIECSMSRRGDCWDNAPMESFMGALKTEWTRHHRYRSVEEVHRSLFEYIEIFYNRRRLHQALGYVSPQQFEDQMAAA